MRPLRSTSGRRAKPLEPASQETCRRCRPSVCRESARYGIPSWRRLWTLVLGAAIAHRKQRLRETTERTLCPRSLADVARARVALLAHALAAWLAAPERVGGAAAADSRIDQSVRRPARARARRPRADSHRELARGGSRGIAVRERSAAAHAELRHGRGALGFAPDVVLAGTYTSPFTRAMLRRAGLPRRRARARDIGRRHRAQRAARRGDRRPGRTRRAADREAARGSPSARSEPACAHARRRHRATRRLHGRRGLARERAARRSPACATSRPSAGSTAGAACRWRRCCAARPS